MRLLLILLVSSWFFCGCSDMSEQKAIQEKLKEGLKAHQIMRVTDDEIVAAAHARGDSVLQQLNELKTNFGWGSEAGSAIIDSLNDHHPQQIITFIKASATGQDLPPMELQLLEAYQYSVEQKQIPTSNVQLLDDQWVLFTSPVMEAGQFVGMWSIRQSKKTIILGLE